MYAIWHIPEHVTKLSVTDDVIESKTPLILESTINTEARYQYLAQPVNIMQRRGDGD